MNNNNLKPNAMQYKRFAGFTVILLALVALWSCEYEKIVPEVPPVNDSVSYAADIQPIWNSGCTGCHGVGLTAPDLTAANSYNSLVNGGYINVADPASSGIYTCMISGGSMSQYTNAAEAALVLQWIQQGAKNN